MDNVFHRRMEISKILMSGQLITVKQMSLMFSVGKRSIERDLEILGEYYPIISIRGRYGGYRIGDGTGIYQDSLTKEQLNCLEDLLMICNNNQQRIVKEIIYKYGPYMSNG